MSPPTERPNANLELRSHRLNALRARLLQHYFYRRKQGIQPKFEKNRWVFNWILFRNRIWIRQQWRRCQQWHRKVRNNKNSTTARRLSRSMWLFFIFINMPKNLVLVSAMHSIKTSMLPMRSFCLLVLSAIEIHYPHFFSFLFKWQCS